MARVLQTWLIHDTATAATDVLPGLWPLRAPPCGPSSSTGLRGAATCKHGCPRHTTLPEGALSTANTLCPGHLCRPAPRAPRGRGLRAPGEALLHVPPGVIRCHVNIRLACGAVFAGSERGDRMWGKIMNLKLGSGLWAGPAPAAPRERVTDQPSDRAGQACRGPSAGGGFWAQPSQGPLAEGGRAGTPRGLPEMAKENKKSLLN